MQVPSPRFSSVYIHFYRENKYPPSAQVLHVDSHNEFGLVGKLLLYPFGNLEFTRGDAQAAHRIINRVSDRDKNLRQRQENGGSILIPFIKAKNFVATSLDESRLAARVYIRGIGGGMVRTTKKSINWALGREDNSRKRRR